MRSKKEIEQELEYFEDQVTRCEHQTESNERDMPRYKEKIKLLQWVLGEEDKDVK